jgi:hypothetical protein
VDAIENRVALLLGEYALRILEPNQPIARHGHAFLVESTNVSCLNAAGGAVTV